MGRPPLPVGTFGQIHFLRLDTHRVAARTYFRDLDGRRRLVTRYGQTRAQAERRLREALRDRGTCTAPPVPADSRLSAMAALWLADVDSSDRASGTKRLYRFVTDSYVLPALGELRQVPALSDPDAERVELDASIAQVQAAPAVPARPLAVLTKTEPFAGLTDLPGLSAAEINEVYQRAEDHFVALAPATPQVFATGSDQYIQFSQSDLVVHSTELVLGRMRAPDSNVLIA